MYGADGKIGLIVPSPNTVVEPEFRALLPEGVEAYASRCLYPETKDEKAKYEFYRNIRPLVLKAALEVASVKPDLIVWACTLGSLLPGDGSDIGLADDIQRETGFPAITTTASVIEFLKVHRLQRIGLFTPYTEFFTAKMKEYIASRVKGLEFAGEYNQGIVEGFGKASVGVDNIYPLIRSLTATEKKLDGLFISCTNVPTLEIVESLSRELGIHVFSSMTATVWLARRRMGYPVHPPVS